jgi:hypothetical protein
MYGAIKTCQPEWAVAGIWEPGAKCDRLIEYCSTQREFIKKFDPHYVIIHTGHNDLSPHWTNKVEKTVAEASVLCAKLCNHIQELLPICKVVFSAPFPRKLEGSITPEQAGRYNSRAMGIAKYVMKLSNDNFQVMRVKGVWQMRGKA